MHPDQLAAAAERSVLAEVGYRRADGRVDTTVLVPLSADGTVYFALPYAQRATAEQLATASAVVIVCSEGRVALRSWSPAAGAGRLDLDADATGERFAEELLDQELRKHPPARPLADSLVARREHWWFLPRLLLRFVSVTSVWPVGARRAPDEGVLFWSEDGLRADTVSVGGGGEDLRLMSLGGHPLPGTGKACLLRHDCSIPDLERRTALTVRGRLHGPGQLRVEERHGALELPPPAGLLTRYRAARAFERACRRALAADGAC